jgi:hypothetical protein
MISHGRNYLPTWWWYSAFPGLAIYLTVLGLQPAGRRTTGPPRSQVARHDVSQLSWALDIELTSVKIARPSASVGAHP